MILFLTVLHILVALLLILFVLIQDSKGDGVFGMGGGGGSNQVLSSTGAANFLVKTTRTLAVVFAITSIALTYLTSKHGGSVTDTYVPPPAASIPAAPGATAGQTAAPEAAKPADGKPADPAAAAKPADATKPADAQKQPLQEPKSPEGDN
jgi:preprotein translocase subunit SecG